MLDVIKKNTDQIDQYVRQIEDLKIYWENEFFDIPWKSKSLRVSVERSLETLEFYFIFERITDFPKIDVSLIEGKYVDTSAIEFDWKHSENEPGLFLTIRGLMPDQIDHLIFEQNSDSIKPAKLVCLQKDNNEWVVIYNSFDRFKALMAGWAEQSQGRSTGLDKTILKFSEFLFSEKFNEANQIFEQILSSFCTKNQLNWLTDKFDVAFNAHGLKRTFKYWSTDERHRYLNSALNIIETLKPHFPNICLSGGSILGFKRTGKLLDHDDDLDIVVGVPKAEYGGLGPTLDSLAKILIAAGYKIKGYFFAHLWVETDSSTGQTLDVFVAIMEDDFASFYPSHRKSMKSTDLFPPTFGMIEDIEVPLPGDVDGYLEGVYGINWRTPDHAFRHPWNRQEYLDLSGSRKHKVIWTRGEVAALNR
jgi:hypothetical protein